MDWSGVVIEGRYRVERTLGRGGMGTAFLARDERVGRSVVLKAPHEGLLAVEGFRERFDREIRSLLDLEHPHIVKVLDVGLHESIPFMVLQFLGGGTLRDRLLQLGGSQTTAEVVRWLPDVATALDFLHQRQWLHRDIKPDNLLFDTSGHVYLSDFGIAKAANAVTTGLTATGLLPGSPRYMAPECGLGAPIGPAYDQYALAITVYEALSGRVPFGGTDPIHEAAAKLVLAPRSLAEVAPEVPVGTVAAVMRGLAKDPRDRFASCSAFANAVAEGPVRALARGIETIGTDGDRTPPAGMPPIHATQAPSSPVASTNRRPRRARTIVGIALGLAAVVGTALALRPGDRTEGVEQPMATGASSAPDRSATAKLPAPAAGPEPSAPVEVAPHRPPSPPLAPTQDRALVATAQTAFDAAWATLDPTVPPGTRTARSEADAVAQRARKEFVAGDFVASRASWDEATRLTHGIAATESDLREVRIRLEALNKAIGTQGWSSAGTVVSAKQVAEGVLRSAETAWAAGDVATARATAGKAGELVEAAQALSEAAKTAEDVRARWSVLARRIDAGPLYAAARDGLMRAKASADAASRDLDAGRFSEATTTLQTAIGEAAELLARHDRAQTAARDLRRPLAATMPDAAVSAALRDAYAAAIAAADLALAEGRFDDVATGVAEANAAAKQAADAVTQGRLRAEPARRNWESVVTRAPKTWFDEIAPAASAALSVGRRAQASFDLLAFDDAIRDWQAAASTLAPLLDQDAAARTAAEQARSTWEGASTAAKAAGRLLAPATTVASEANGDFAAGRYKRAESAWRTAATRAEADRLARTKPYELDLSAGEGRIPPGWTADPVVRIGTNRALFPHGDRAKGSATSDPISMVGDFNVSSRLLFPRKGGAADLAVSLVGASGSPSLEVSVRFHERSSVSRGIWIRLGSSRSEEIRTSAAGGTVTIERRGTEIRILVDGRFVTATSVPIQASYAAVSLRWDGLPMGVAGLTVSPSGN